MNRRLGFVVAGAGFLLATSFASAAVIAPGSYRLSNHPDGNQAPPYYGLRLDELFNLTSNHDVFTFDFNRAGTAMYLDYNGSSIHIYGRAFGGRDTGSGYSSTNSGFWDIDFTYATVVPVPGDDDLWVTPPQTPNTGSIRYNTSTSVNPVQNATFAAAGAIPLYDYPGSFPYTFRLGDENNDLGHRGFSGISGWGWLNHRVSNTHVSASDWLFTMNPVPLPGGVLLAALGLFSGAGFTRFGKRNKAAA